MRQRCCSTAFMVVWGAVVALAVLHQDFWNWDNRTLWFGVIPVGLGFHALFSVACALTWASVVKWAWPSHLEIWADQPALDDGEASGLAEDA